MKLKLSYQFWILLLAIVIHGRFSQAQQLGFTLNTDSVVHEFQNYISFYASGNIQNLSNSDSITIDVIRIENDMPPGWESGICIITCLPASYDSTAITLGPGQSQLLKMYFRKNYGAIGDTAHTKLLIQDHINPVDYFLQNFYGIDTIPDFTSINEITGMNELSVIPNPFSGKAIIYFPREIKNGTLMIYDSRGQLIQTHSDVNGKFLEINDQHLAQGLYHVSLNENKSYYPPTKAFLIK